MSYGKIDLTIDEAIRAIQTHQSYMRSYDASKLNTALDMAVDALREKQERLAMYPRGGKRRRPVVRVNEATGEVVRFKMAKDARESLNIPEGSFGRIVMTNSLRDGYRFYYEEDWDG